MNRSATRVLALWAAGLSCTVPALGQPRAIDAGRSTITVRVSRAGVLSALGHDHTISAPITRGTVDVNARQVELNVNARAFQVRDPGVSDKDRGQIQSTMLGPEVLDAQRYPEIVFRSTGVEPAGADSWTVNGNLTLRGETRPVTVVVRQESGHYLGDLRLKQTQFDIQPVKVAGGTIRVKDEIRIEFDIQLAR